MNKSLIYRLLRFCALDRKNRIEILRIVYLHYYSQWLVKYKPLRNYFKYFQVSKEEPVSQLEQYKGDIRRIRRIINKLPMRTTCLKESIVVHLFFKAKGIQIPIRLGVQRGESLSAHAWYDENNSGDYCQLVNANE